MSQLNGNLKTRAKTYGATLQSLFQQKELTGKLKFVWRGARHITFGVRLQDALRHKDAVALAEPFALKVGVQTVIAVRMGGFIIYQLELPKSEWQSYTRTDVQGLVLGYGDMRRPVSFEFDPPHSLVAGTSGSGKTETVRSITCALCETFSPGELQLAVVDPHHDYDEFRNVAHLAGPIAHSGDDIKTAISWAAGILYYRRTHNIRVDRPHNTPIPKIVLVMDETDSDIVLRDSDNLRLVADLAQQSRKYGVHLIVGVQKATHKKMPDILDNLAHKLVGQVTDAGVSARLTGREGLECHKLTGKGDFVQVRGSNVTRFQVAQATQDNIEQLDKGEVGDFDQTTVLQATYLQNMPDEGDSDEDEWDSETIEVADVLIEPKKNGRPALKLDMKLLARYCHFGPDFFSIDTARNDLSPIMGYDVTRGLHTKHRDAAIRLLKELEALRNVNI